MNLSIVIPAYNEEKRIKYTLKEIISYLQKRKIKYEILVIDDGSTDKTLKIIRDISKRIRILSNKKNSGKGFSIKKGILNSKYNLVLFTDADLATPIAEIEPMLNYIEKGYDIIIASRNLKESRIVVNQPLYRQLLGKAFPWIVRVFLGLNIKDTQCGFKLFKTNIAKKIVSLQTVYGFCFDAELLYIAKLNKYKIKEVPVAWFDKEGSKVSPIKDSIKMLKDLIRIKINSMYGKYQQ